MIERGDKYVVGVGFIKNVGEIFLPVVTQVRKITDWVTGMAIVSKEKKDIRRQNFTPHKEDETNANLSIIGPEPSIPLTDVYGRIDSL
ncbi:MAG: hypothetical protein CV087_15735 [Candidatus Brocadia sp. WS118]|nr:MAG: hypothetical protein CV087_15735 [Candidatus Brocadia sp. WS118]